MKKAIALTVALAAVSLTLCAKEKCKIRITIADSIGANEIVITRFGEDPAKSPYCFKADTPTAEYEFETDEIEKFQIWDWGEIREKGHTERVGNFFVEDGAVINARVSASEIAVTSTGKEYTAWADVDSMALKVFSDRELEISNMPDSVRGQAEEAFMDDYRLWTLNYYSSHPMLGFLFDLDQRLKSFNLTDNWVRDMLGIY